MSFYSKGLRPKPRAGSKAPQGFFLRQLDKLKLYRSEERPHDEEQSLPALPNTSTPSLSAATTTLLSTNSSQPVTTFSSASSPASNAHFTLLPHERPKHYLYAGLYTYPGLERYIEPNLKEKWAAMEERLRSPLGEVAQNDAQLVVASESEDASPDLMVLFTCSDEASAGALKWTATNIRWFQQFLVENGLKSRFGTSAEIIQTAADNFSAKNFVEARSWVSGKCMLEVREELRTLCGLKIISLASKQTKLCTLGGPILVGDVLYALTSRHVFDTDCTVAVPALPTPEDLLLDLQPRSYPALVGITYPQISKSHLPSSTVDLDYALLEISRLPLDSLKEVIAPVALDGSAISRWSKGTDRGTGQVTINALGQRVISGVLSPLRRYIHAGESAYSAQLIELEDIMTPGLSGSWVTSNDCLCGQIVAAHVDLPWAYMVPIADIFADIEKRTGKPVRLTTKNDVDKIMVFQKSNKQDFPQLKQGDRLPFRLTYTTQEFSGATTVQSAKYRQDSEHSSTSSVSSLASFKLANRFPLHWSITRQPNSTKQFQKFHRFWHRFPSLPRTGHQVYPADRPEPQYLLGDPFEFAYDSDARAYNFINCLLSSRSGDDPPSIEEQLVSLKWIRSDGSWQEILDMGHSLLLQTRPRDFIGFDCYTKRISCAITGNDLNRCRSMIFIDNIPDWTIGVPAMVQRYRGENPGLKHRLEIYFEFGKIPKIDPQLKPTLQLIQGQMNGSLRLDYLGRSYLSRKALMRIVDNDSTRRLLESVLRSSSLEKNNVQDLLSYVYQKGLHILSIMILAGSIELLQHLPTRLLNDSFLPITPIFFRGMIGNEMMRKVLDYQWKLIPAEFGVTGFSEYPYTLSRAVHRCLPSEMRLPLSFATHHELGKGKFGEVFKVYLDMEHHLVKDRQTQVFAMKRFYGGSRRNHINLDEEKATLRAISEVQHDHILTHIASWRQDTNINLLLDCAPHNIAAFMMTTPSPTLTKDLMLTYLKQLKGLGDALRYIHNQGPASFPLLTYASSSAFDSEECIPAKINYAVHADVKPENILCFYEGEAFPKLKLADFGSARILRLSTDDQPQFSSSQCRYGAPESSLTGTVSRASDIWSLGCVFLELLCWVAQVSLNTEIYTDFSHQARSKQYWWTIDDGVTELEPLVSHTLSTLKVWSSTKQKGVFSNLVQVNEKMLTVDQEARPDAPSVFNSLDAILMQAKIDLRDEGYYLLNEHEWRQGYLEPSPIFPWQSQLSLNDLEPVTGPTTPQIDRYSDEMCYSARTLLECDDSHAYDSSSKISSIDEFLEQSRASDTESTTTSSFTNSRQHNSSAPQNLMQSCSYVCYDMTTSDMLELTDSASMTDQTNHFPHERFLTLN